MTEINAPFRPAPPADPIAPRLLALALLGIVFTIMLAWTWRAWPDPLVDFGREAYIPWRLAAGDRLYIDQNYFNGPLSPYFNALLFSLAAPNLTVLFAANTLIFGLIIVVAFHILRLISSPLPAFVACCSILLLCGFTQTLSTANYNYIAPYSHEMTHGLLLSLGAIAILLKFIQTRNGWWLVLSGMCCGAATLTKPEIAIAIVPACAIGVALGLLERRAEWSRWLKRYGQLLAGAGIIWVLAFSLLSRYGLGAAGALEHLIAPYLHTLNRDLHALPFYERVAGVHNLAGNLHDLARNALVWLVLTGMGILAGLWLRTDLLRSRIIGFSVAIAVFTMARLLIDGLVFQQMFRAFGVLCLGALVMLAIFTFRRGRASLDRREIGSIVFAIFALLLLAKIRFNVSPQHYGFVLAAPAIMLGIVCLIGWLPNWIDRQRGCGWTMRGAAIGLLAATCSVYLAHAARYNTDRSAFVSEHTWDAARFHPREARVINLLLQTIEQEALSDATLAVIPEGALINLWTHRPSSLRYVSLMPAEAIIFTPERMAQSMIDNAPDLILINGIAGLKEYGKSGLAAYLPELSALIAANYRDITPPQIDPEQFLLLKRIGAR